MEKKAISKSYYIPVGQEELHVQRIYQNPDGLPILMLHGSMENGKIFYSKSGKGLAPYLAKKGFDVFVPDLSGRGLSRPSLSRENKNSQSSAILKEIPALKAFIIEKKGRLPQHWMAHSWGGVLMLSYIARFGSEKISSFTFFGTKRRISVIHPEKVFKVDIMWNLVGKILSMLYGYFPARKYKFGSDDEPRLYHSQIIKWVYAKKWIDPLDGFDYHKALKKVKIPPTLYLAAINDTFLGHPKDVKYLMAETNGENDKFVLLSKENGHLHNYNHISILTHPDAIIDQFSIVERWIEEQENDS